MDIAFLLALQNFRTSIGGALDGFFYVLSDVGVAIAGIVLPMIVLWCISKEAGTFLFLSFGLGDTVTTYLKNTFCIYRPWMRDTAIAPVQKAMVNATGYSFPSGHSHAAANVLGGVAVWWRKKRSVVICCILGILLIGFSRLYLGVHTPQDVLVGFAVGLLMVLICWKMLHWVDAKPNRDVVVLIICIILAVGVLFYCLLKSYPTATYADGTYLIAPTVAMYDGFKSAGILLAVSISWFIERRFIHYTIEGSRGEKIVRALAGIAIVAVIFLLAYPWLKTTLGSGWGDFICYGSMYLFAMLIYPPIFNRVHKAVVAKRQRGTAE